jgi:hypothetical protein
MSMAASRTETLVGRSATKWRRLNGYRRGRERCGLFDRAAGLGPGLGQSRGLSRYGDVHGAFSELLLKMTLSTEVMRCDD